MFNLFVSQLIKDIEGLESALDPMIILDNHYAKRREYTGRLSYYILFYALDEAGNDILIENEITLRQTNHEPWACNIKNPQNFKDSHIDNYRLSYEHHREVII
jgi:hypothetical protein